jgi:hypothetical protein
MASYNSRTQLKELKMRVPFFQHTSPRSGFDSLNSSSSDLGKPKKNSTLNTIRIACSLLKNSNKTDASNDTISRLSNVVNEIVNSCKKYAPIVLKALFKAYAKATAFLFSQSKKFASEHPSASRTLGVGLFAGSIALACINRGVGILVFRVTMPIAAGLFDGAMSERGIQKRNYGQGSLYLDLT